MSQTKVAKLLNVSVDGKPFKWIPNQDVYVFAPDDTIKEGKIIEAGSYPNASENQYRIELISKVRTIYPESLLIGRRWAMFDKQGKQIEGKIFYNLQEAIDSEEDYGYDSLSTQYHAAKGIPVALVSEEIEVWEINEAGIKIGDGPVPLD